MKNLFFALAFMLVGTFAFASVDVKTPNESITKTKIVEELTITHVKIKNNGGTCTIYHSVYRNGKHLGDFEIIAPASHEDCGGVVFHVS